MTKWKEVSAYTGQPVEEDAPSNFAGTGSGVDMNPTGKKKKSLLDARTKTYREHKAKLEAARIKRENARKSKFVEKVKESVNNFNRESFLEENNMNVLKDIVVRKSAKPLKFKDGTMQVDLTTASTITQIYNKVNIDNQKKLEKMVNGTKGQFQAMVSKVMKMVSK
jgi:hypothetical protein|tara:strand:+ start:172 stop:669 length:498 start_codon:yes stop_codon:yes gene_type:complete